MNYYASYVQFTDGTHDLYAGLAKSGLDIQQCAKEKFGKDVLFTHSTIIAPNVEEGPDSMYMEARIWYGIHEKMEVWLHDN